MKYLSLLLFYSLTLLLSFTPQAASAAAGDLDALNLSLSGTSAQVKAMAQQPDGKLIIGGSFTQVLGVARSNIARLNADGTLDTAFDPKVNGAVNTVAVHADGKVSIGGDFSSLQPNGAATETLRYYYARLNADGTLDGSITHPLIFNSAVHAMALQADGRLLVAGAFQTVGYAGEDPWLIGYDGIVRLNVDGTRDSSFVIRPNAPVYCVAVRPDGKILIAGAFRLVSPNVGFTGSRRCMALVNADGTVDASFDPRPDDTVTAMALQPDGKILIGGVFSLLDANRTGNVARSRIARVNADGTLDTGFNPGADAQVNSLALQTDGQVLVGGEFTTLGGGTRNRIGRLTATGTLDSGVNPNANGIVTAVAVQADGRVLLGGQFSTLTPNGGAAGTRGGFARLLNDAATQTLTATGGSTLTWLRGGTAPEVYGVAFEQSVDSGSTWTALGAGSRVAGGWQLTGLSLPAAGQLRAQAHVAGGNGVGSSGLLRQVINLETAAQAAVRAWAAGLGVPAGSQDLLDDPDGDGHTNLQEFAFGTGPLNPATGALEYSGTPAGGGTLVRTGQPWVMSETVGDATVWHALFVRRTNHVAAGLRYSVGFSGDLAAWETSATVPAVLADDGTHQVVRGLPRPGGRAGSAVLPGDGERSSAVS